MSAPDSATHAWTLEGDALKLTLLGDWAGNACTRLGAPPPQPPQGGARTLVIDTTRLGAVDGGLAAALHPPLAALQAQGVTLDLAALPDVVRSVLALALSSGRIGLPPWVAPPTGVAAFGHSVIQGAAQARITVAFFGEVLIALGRLLRGRSDLQASDFWHQVDLAGPRSVPIVGLTCLLIGLMLAYMGGAQLWRIGASNYIPDIVTVGMVRELAGLMTGVILAGRLGASFAAQIGTMQAGEEIDALRAMGVDPISYLVLPRLLALLAVAPLLIGLGMLIGTLAGLPAAVAAYGLTASEYLHQCLKALTWTHLWIGLAKGTLYLALVAIAGCREGLNAGRDAQAVGAATTKAVVKALMWIVMAACGTTVVLQSLGF